MEETNKVSLSLPLKNGLTLAIRTMVPEDADDFIRHMQTVVAESDNLTFSPEDLHMTPETERRRIEDFHRDGRSVMLAGLIDGKLSAVSTLRCAERKRIRHNAEFSLTVLKKYWNIGAGDAMLQAVISYARTRGDIKTIELGVKATNAGAIHLYEKHGFVQIGVHKNAMRFGDDYVDSNMMDLYL
jgi:RimJ/RimL family protein N-acetyltransferase